ncbi:MAG: hypothetical protein ABR562_07655 [Thermoplasmatota archaeon]
MRLLPPLAVLLLAATALAGCGGEPDPTTVDTDRDGLPDAQETAGWGITVESLTDRTMRHVTSDPTVPDTDLDGVSDLYEFALRLDPRAADTDGDGLTDCQEKQHTVRAQCEDPAFAAYDGGYHTEADHADSDIGYSRYVNRPGGVGAAQPRILGDGIPDGAELRGYDVTLANGTARHVHGDPRDKDSDRDGLEDGEEAFVYGTDPSLADTDGDGCPDGLDPVPAYAETYGPGLRSITLQGDGPADLEVSGVLANAVYHSSAAAVRGSAMDLAEAEPAPMHSDACSFTPVSPWVALDVQVSWADAPGGARLLDLSSMTRPDAASPLYWNVQSGKLSWDDRGRDAWAGPATWTGLDGTLVFQPQVHGVPPSHLATLAAYVPAGGFPQGT